MGRPYSISEFMVPALEAATRLQTSSRAFGMNLLSEAVLDYARTFPMILEFELLRQLGL